MALLDRLSAPGAKRILALDGGGIRGALTLGFLERMEEMLRARHRNPDLRLCDYFDLIGGTSTGAIIAAGLAIGKSAAEIKEMYLRLGGRVFPKSEVERLAALAHFRLSHIPVELFDQRPLEEELADGFGDVLLGGPEVLSGLCIVTKRADTGSTWPLVNHPRARFYEENKSILLRKALRASTAAPTYFKPELVEVGGGVKGAFVDGGVSMANNPALELLLVATLQGFPFRWPTGEDRLLLVSVGAGHWHDRQSADHVVHSQLWDWAREVPAMLMDDASLQGQLLLQYISRTPTPVTINDEIGDLSNDLLHSEPVLTYIRYNADLTEAGLRALELDSLCSRVVSLRDMSAGDNRYDLAKIGEAAAARQVREEHLPSAFDLETLL